jgi:hypothetical protein
LGLYRRDTEAQRAERRWRGGPGSTGAMERIRVRQFHDVGVVCAASSFTPICMLVFFAWCGAQWVCWERRCGLSR